MNDIKNYIEESIIRQIADIELSIRDLNDEKAALQRLLLRTRREDITRREVTRKNSVNRILVEDKILELLAHSTKPVSGPDLYSAAKTVIVDLNKNTFRSRLMRMKNRGALERVEGYKSLWKLPE